MTDVQMLDQALNQFVHGALYVGAFLFILVKLGQSCARASGSTWLSPPKENPPKPPPAPPPSPMRRFSLADE